MEIYTLPVSTQMETIIRKITVFICGEYSAFKQKLTPTPYSCLTYNHYTIPELMVNNEILTPSHRIQVTGPKTRDDIYALHYGKLSQVLIEFTVTGFFSLFGKTPLELLNITVPIDHLCRNSLVLKMTDDLTKTDNPNSHAEILQSFMDSENKQMHIKFYYLYQAVRMIESSFGNISVGDISRQINISERQLNRKFLEVTGLKPIQYIKLKQLHYIINLLHTRQFISLKELAYETGFYDPAHFNHHFKKLTGMSPGAFLASDEHVAFKYYNDLKGT